LGKRIKMDKIKLLFVVKGFSRAGAERFVYEIDSALDKENYEVTILCLEKESKINSNSIPYYKSKHINLGSKIVFLDTFLITYTPIRRIISKINKVIFKQVYESNIDTEVFNSYLLQFDVISWIGEYTFFNSLAKENLNKSLIHIMSARFQNPNLYKNFDFEYPYNFVSGFHEHEHAHEFMEFKKINHYYLPLLLKIPFEKKPWNFINSPVKKIGIFTRLDRYKPLDPFFYSFQLLQEKLPNCELHVFGNGDPEKEGMTRYLKNLGITDFVFFRGHQENILETVLNENINLSWFQGHNNNKPGGYAGFDLCTTGTPLVCWDFMEKPIDPFNEVYPHYKSITQFVAKSYELLTNSESAEKLSILQFDHISSERNVEKHIHVLEEIYLQIQNPI